MKNIKMILFFVLIGIYAIGICVGSLSQVRAHTQDEMYEYLEVAVSDYDARISDSIKSVATDNAKTLLVMLIFGFFGISPIITGTIVMLKGYSAGFAITTMLRLYGLKGLFFCGANLISAVVLVPALAYYGGVGAHNFITNRYNRKIFLKNCFIFLIILTAIFCVDSITRGFFSSIFMNLAKTA